MNEPITVWLEDLKEADEAAAQKLWQRYYRRLVALARKILESSRRQAIDEEDVATSAFKSFCHRAAKGEFPQLNDRDDLWKLLMTITVRKALKVRRREHKSRLDAKGRLLLGELLAKDPDPEMAAELADQFQFLLGRLPNEQMRRIALLKLEGHKNGTIARRVNRSVATVERKLKLVRLIWSKQLDP